MSELSKAMKKALDAIPNCPPPLDYAKSFDTITEAMAEAGYELEVTQRGLRRTHICVVPAQ